MGVRESWNELGTGGKILIGVVVAGVVLFALAVLAILALVLGSFAVGMGDASSASTSPQMAFSADYDASNETAEIIHEGGHSVESAELLIKTADRTFEWEDQDEKVSAGDSTVIEVSPDTTVRVVWTGEEESTVLFSETVQ